MKRTRDELVARLAAERRRKYAEREALAARLTAEYQRGWAHACRERPTIAERSRDLARLYGGKAPMMRL